jgi:hypothetical protein
MITHLVGKSAPIAGHALHINLSNVPPKEGIHSAPFHLRYPVFINHQSVLVSEFPGYEENNSYKDHEEPGRDIVEEKPGQMEYPSYQQDYPRHPEPIADFREDTSSEIPEFGDGLAP